MHLPLFIISCISFIQLFITDSECSEKSFRDKYYVMKRVKRQTSNIRRNDTVTTTNILRDQFKVALTTGDDKRTRSESKQKIFSQDDVLSSRFQAPEFACNRNHSKAAEIYCYGDILHVVMMLGLYRDSKTFVDKPLKKNPDEVIVDFQRRFSNTITEEDREEVEQFVEDNFGVEGEELDGCELSDWKEKPERLLTIKNSALRQFALQINYLWKNLCRTVKKKVKEQPQRYSLIYVPNEFIVPGGRFREYYYWDAYWIIKGLLASDKLIILLVNK
ncbi:Trehalase family protein [Acanthocheilonema viteae]